MCGGWRCRFMAHFSLPVTSWEFDLTWSAVRAATARACSVCLCLCGGWVCACARLHLRVCVRGEALLDAASRAVGLLFPTGTLSFFLDSLRYGEHVVLDVGTAFEDMRGAPGSSTGVRTLHPMIAFKRGSDSVRACVRARVPDRPHGVDGRGSDVTRAGELRSR